MYSGHFAVGLGLHARFPRVRAWIFMLGVGLLDVVDGILIAVGLERVSAAPKEPLGFDLDFIDWDHSLVMALVWSAAFAFLFRKDRRVALLAGLAVFSHFLCDVLVHNGDLALWPYSRVHLGLYLWHRLPVGSWFLEGAFDLPFAAYFAVQATRRGASRGEVARVLGLLAFLHLSFSPWLSPMKLIARTVPQPLVSVLHGVLVAMGFAVPAWLFSRWLPSPAEELYQRGARGC
ncbi:MAG: metal-dependent hydrolase [Myxococcales bacterium]